MSPGGFYKKVFSPLVWLNVLAMVIVVVLVLVGAGIAMNVYTRHGQVVSVPDVTRMAMLEARRVLVGAGLAVEVTDTGYVKELPRDCILEQKPAAGTNVKEGHVISLIVNASRTPTIALPDIIQNCSLREAEARLKSMGFRVGETQYVRGEREWVYGVTVAGVPKKTGDRISVNDIVVIQAGDGYMSEEDSVVYVDYDPAGRYGGDAPYDEDFGGGETESGRDDFMEIPD